MGYYGYHTLPQGISIINDIKICMNSFTLTNSSKFNEASFSIKVSISLT